jgi:hypothetical protein
MNRFKLIYRKDTFVSKLVKTCAALSKPIHTPLYKKRRNLKRRTENKFFVLNQINFIIFLDKLIKKKRE